MFMNLIPLTVPVRLRGNIYCLPPVKHVVKMTLIDLLVRRAKRKYSKKYKLIITLLGIIFFAVLVPAAIIYTSLALDAMLRLGLPLEPYNIVLGLVLIIASISFAAWALWCQWNIGKGTPVPVAPTQKLIVTGPYAYCRNPMVFGVLLYYLGLVLAVGSLMGLGVVFIFGVLASMYVKFVEEKELELRFGDEYVEYEKNTPFVIPRPRRLRQAKG